MGIPARGSSPSASLFWLERIVEDKAMRGYGRYGRRRSRRIRTGMLGLLLLAAGIGGFVWLEGWNVVGLVSGAGIPTAAAGEAPPPAEATFAVGDGSGADGAGTKPAVDQNGSGTQSGEGGDNAGMTPPPKESEAPPTAPVKPSKPAPGDHRKLIALTFDDGPDHKYTPQILDILKEYDVKATFFLVGTQVAKYPEIAKRIVDEGHSIGNHTWAHGDLTKQSSKTAADQIGKAQKAIKDATGIAPRLIRAPYGAVSDGVLKTVHEAGMLHVGWTIDTKDWAGSSVANIHENVMTHARDGGVVLMHSFGGRKNALEHTVKVLPKIIKDLKAKGFDLVSVDEMIDSGHSRSSVIK